MTIFGDLKSDGLEETNDRLGGYALLETNIYETLIKAAFAGKSDGGAHNVTLVMEIGGQEVSKTIYITNKKGENWFLNKDDKSKKVPLPGFTQIDDLCLMTTGKPLSEQDSAEKVVRIYDYDEKKDLPKSVQMLIDLVGKKVYTGLWKQTVDKNEKDESTGEYVPTGDTREENEIDKFYHFPSKITAVEAREAQKSGKDAEPVFFEKWLEKNKGKDRNRAKGKDGKGVQTGKPGSGNGGPPQAGDTGTTTKTTKSLFGS